ncbi:uncharacterized protein DS421_9g260490 [Arachis hypogaea]|nr:uncharacterized protein DS421_9g260490 [Arachis hypogaea]
MLLLLFWPPENPRCHRKTAAESSMLAGCARSLSRVTVVLVTGCGVGVAGTATGAAASWFPRVRVVETVAKVAWS